MQDASTPPADPGGTSTSASTSTQAAPVEAAGTPAEAPLPAGADAPPSDEVTQTIAAEVQSFSSDLQQLIDEPSFEQAVDTFLPLLLSLGKAIVAIVIILLVVSFVSKWVSRAVNKALSRTKLEATLQKFLVRLVSYAVWIIAIPIAFGVLGIQATSLAALIGAAGLAIGLGLQGALSNISAGVMLLILRPIHIGDFVEVGDELGEVKDLGLFYTTLNTFSNHVVSVPNSEVFGNKIDNLTGHATRRIEVPIGVAYGTDLKQAERVLLEAAQSVGSRDTSKEVAALLTGFGASSIDFEVRVYCATRSYFEVRHDTIHAINAALAEANIEIPFPQRTLSGAIRIEKEAVEQG